MNRKLSKALQISSVLCLGSGVQSLAQADAPTPAGGSLAVVAQNTAVPLQLAQAATRPQAENGALEEIIVTARKREERAQDTPISLTVSSGEDLRNRSVAQFVELQQQTPALHIVPAVISTTATNLSMRGQALVDIRLGIDPTIGIYQDGVYLPRAMGSNAGELIDMQRVEVLAGPQGTLFGKNTTGGAINMFTQTPTDKFEGFVRARYGEYGEHLVAAVLNLPVSSTLAFRLVATSGGMDGYGRNTPPVGQAIDGHITSTPNNEVDYHYFRGSARWTPNDDLTLTWRGDYLRQNDTRAYNGFAYLAPLTPGVGLGGPLGTVETALEMNHLSGVGAFFALPAATQAAYLRAADAKLRTYSVDPDNTFDNVPSQEDVRVWGNSITVDYRLSDALALKSITAVRAFIRQGSTDLDGSPFSLLEYPYSRTSDRQFSEEGQISGDFLEHRLNSIGGVYYSYEGGWEDTDQTALPILGAPDGTTVQNARVLNRSVGIFNQHTYALNSQWSVTGGLRWSKDLRFLNANVYNQTTCNSLGVPLTAVGGPTGCFDPRNLTFSAWSYTANVTYKPVDDVMLYFTTRRGYRAGGLQQTSGGPDPAAVATSEAPFQPEILTDFELGIKSEFLDHRLRVNADIYHSRVQDAIRNVSAPVPGTTEVAALVQNAASVFVDGIEFDTTYLPIRQVEFSLNGALTNGRFGKYTTPTGEDRKSIPLLFTPAVQLGASAAYIANTSYGPWRTQLDESYTSKQLSAEVGAYSPPHALMNLRSSVKWESQNLEVAVYLKNVTDKRYLVYPVDITSSLGFIIGGIYNPPRMYGLELTKGF